MFDNSLKKTVNNEIQEESSQKKDTNILIKNMKGIDRIRYIKTYGKNND